jgi:hypothetical protein
MVRRMQDIMGRDLPELAWLGYEKLSRKKWRPVELAPEEFLYVNKPYFSGLWASPLKRSASGRVLGCAWSLREHDDDEPVEITLVHPFRSARVLQVDTAEDLLAAIKRWPDRRLTVSQRDCWLARPGRSDYCAIDWVTLARDYDIFWLTPEGVNKAGDPGLPVNLWGWDVPTALFLQPVFKVGARLAAPYPGWQADRGREIKAIMASVRDAHPEGLDEVAKEQLGWLREVMLGKP